MMYVEHRIERLGGAGILLIVSVLQGACGSTGQDEISYPIYGAGRAPQAFSAGEWQVTLDVARVGFGPLYLCATAAASSSLCPAAVAEWTSAAEIDALDPMPQQLGAVTGVTGALRSATYDFAITWLATQQAATPTAGAPGGHSARFEGQATRGATTLRFVADVDVAPQIRDSRAVQGARVIADIVDENVRLDVGADPAAWWRSVDFAELEGLGGDPVVVPTGSRAMNALVIGMTATSPPTFAWTTR